jgi:serine/threonine protein kinase
MIEPDTTQRLIAELKIQFFCRHPNIAQLYGLFHDEKSIYLVQEYAGRDSLFTLKKRSKKNRTVEIVSNLIGQLC